MGLCCQWNGCVRRASVASSMPPRTALGTHAARRGRAVSHAKNSSAATISANARHVATELDRPYLRLCRPAWQPSPGDTRIDVPDIAAAARQISARATAFLVDGQIAPGEHVRHVLEAPRQDLAGRSVPQLVTQIADGENGGVMMNEVPCIWHCRQGEWCINPVPRAVERSREQVLIV